MNKPITIRPIAPKDNESVAALMMHQDERLHGLDGRLRPPRSTDTIQTFMAEKVTADALVALDEREAVRALAIPGVWEIGEDEEMRGFFLPRNGTVGLALPHPVEPEAATVTRALLDAVEAWWQQQAVDGTLITWPAADGWPAPFSPNIIIPCRKFNTITAIR